MSMKSHPFIDDYSNELSLLENQTNPLLTRRSSQILSPRLVGGDTTIVFDQRSSISDSSSRTHSSRPQIPRLRYESTQSFDEDLESSPPDVHGLLSDPSAFYGDISDFNATRKSYNERKRIRIEKMPEKEFLNLLAGQPSSEAMKDLIKTRYDYLSRNDYADKMNKMKPTEIALSRAPAILATLTLEMFVGLVIASHKETIKRHILLSSFLPVLASIAGNVGLQASTASLRALSMGHASANDISDVFRLIFKEFLCSTVLASGACTILFLMATSWSNNWRFGVATGLGILCNGSLAGIMGSLAPVTFRALNIDPAFMAGPFETAIQDLVGTTVYLTLASLILN